MNYIARLYINDLSYDIHIHDWSDGYCVLKVYRKTHIKMIERVLTVEEAKLVYNDPQSFITLEIL
jgi:hypothetical protein